MRRILEQLAMEPLLRGVCGALGVPFAGDSRLSALLRREGEAAT